jgi:hypothetical protein
VGFVLNWNEAKLHFKRKNIYEDMYKVGTHLEIEI